MTFLRSEVDGKVYSEPEVVDGIARRCWGRVYRNAARDQNVLAAKFIAANQDVIVRLSPRELHPLTPEDLMAHARRSKPSAPGLTGWGPAEWKLLPRSAFVWLCRLLVCIEGGGEWPDQSKCARAVF
eukprot:15461906-Alexandrium_andersonii.AAC.1